MKIEKGKSYHIGPASVTSVLPEDDYLIVDMSVMSFQVEVYDNWFVTSDYAFTPIEEPIVGIPKWIRTGGEKLNEIAELYGFSKRSGFTLPETYFFFSDGRLLDCPTISDKTRDLYNDLLKKRFAREGSTDRTVTKLYNILIDLLEMLLNYSLQEDMYLVPEIRDIIKRGVLCD